MDTLVCSFERAVGQIACIGSHNISADCLELFGDVSRRHLLLLDKIGSYRPTPLFPSSLTDWTPQVAKKTTFLENQLLLISINFTPKTSHSCLKKWYTRFFRFGNFIPPNHYWNTRSSILSNRKRHQNWQLDTPAVNIPRILRAGLGCLGPMLAVDPWARSRDPPNQQTKLKTTLNWTSWWFQIFFMFIPIWGNDPILLIFFKWVETTN